MISILMDEASAFDMMAILGVKWLATQDLKFLADTDKLRTQIVKQLGLDKEIAVRHSDEYDKLFEANRLIFKRIDEIKQRGEQPGDATYIDQQNYQRFLHKRAIQERFFSGELAERKVGYGNGLTSRPSGLD